MYTLLQLVASVHPIQCVTALILLTSLHPLPPMDCISVVLQNVCAVLQVLLRLLWQHLTALLLSQRLQAFDASQKSIYA